MNPEQMSKLINSVGFPIVMCIALFYVNYYMMERQSQIISEFKDAMYANILATEKRNARAEYIIERIETLDSKLEECINEL